MLYLARNVFNGRFFRVAIRTPSLRETRNIDANRFIFAASDHGCCLLQHCMLRISYSSCYSRKLFVYPFPVIVLFVWIASLVFLLGQR